MFAGRRRFQGWQVKKEYRASVVAPLDVNTQQDARSSHDIIDRLCESLFWSLQIGFTVQSWPSWVSSLFWNQKISYKASRVTAAASKDCGINICPKLLSLTFKRYTWTNSAVCDLMEAWFIEIFVLPHTFFQKKKKNTGSFSFLVRWLPS